MIEHVMEQTCELLGGVTLDKYGRQVGTELISTNCRFRTITEVQRVSNREDIRGDAFLWLPPDVDVEEGTIIKFNEEFYRVRRITHARRLRGEEVFFLKCILDKHGEVTLQSGS